MMLKWVKTLAIASLALVTVSLMFVYLKVPSGAFSIALNFMLMFWVSLYENQVKPPLDSPYFDSQPFEKDGKFYRSFGVTWYQAVLVKIGWEKLRQKGTPIKKTLRDMEAYERASRSAELGHLVVAVVVLAVTVYVIITYSLRDARWLIITNLFLNIYPVLLQRHIRPRLQHLIARFRASEARMAAKS